MTVARTLLAMALLSSELGACNTPVATTGGTYCALGETVLCQDSFGCAGVRRCLPDTSGFGACETSCDGDVMDGAVTDATRHD